MASAGTGCDEATRSHSRQPSSKLSRAGQFAGAEPWGHAVVLVHSEPGAGGCCTCKHVCSVITWSWIVFSSTLLRKKKEEVPPNGFSHCWRVLFLLASSFICLGVSCTHWSFTHLLWKIQISSVINYNEYCVFTLGKSPALGGGAPQLQSWHS